MIGGPRSPAERIERLRAWVEALTGALESGDLDAVARRFAVECSWQPGPWAPVLRGRAAIRSHLAERLAAMPGLDTSAEILGAGATYGVVHWSLAWGSRGPGERADGVLLVALDPTGRGAAVREWTVDDTPAAGPAAEQDLPDMEPGRRACAPRPDPGGGGRET